MYIKGVNLGNWLVLEKWMNPSMFAGTSAADEYYLPTQLSREAYEERIRMHRAEYITERDFATIQSFGLDSVRIPIPYFVFGDCEPFIGCVEELDKAFAWAEKYDLTILLDLHTVPGSQNGFDNGGISGVCKWSQTPEYVDFTLNALKRLAQRYGMRKGLLGIQPVNEPLTESKWDEYDVMSRYQAVDEKMAEGSGPVPMQFLKEFYLKAYDVVREFMPEDKYFVIHDGFDIYAWKDFMQEEKYKNVILDTHQYLMNAECEGCEQAVRAYVEYADQHFKKEISDMEQYFPVICGEWSLFNSYGCGVDTQGGRSPVNGVVSEETGFTVEQKRYLYSKLADVQLEAWKEGHGFYFWTYKMLLDTVNDPAWNGWDSWDYGKCVAQGWMPVLEKNGGNENE